MISVDLLTGAALALICGLDRIAIFQIMVSRPIVAAPVTALLLGEPLVGLQIGVMVELLWLARLPVGAAVPPDDTQVAIATSVLTVVLGRYLDAMTLEMTLVCLLVAFPLGKIGQFFEHRARLYNGCLPRLVEEAVEQGHLGQAQWQHLRGLFSFALSSVLTYLVIVAGGLLAVPYLWPMVHNPVALSAETLKLALPLIGVAMILGSMNVSRAITLFCAAFGMAFLLLWLV